MSANERQVGGDHYSKHGDLQHWDVVTHFRLDYFQGQITKYLFRWKDKGGVQDLEKAKHYLEKYIEVHQAFKHRYISMEDIAQEYEYITVVQNKFVWEGSKEGEVMFTCKKCRGKVYAKNVIYAFIQHRCPAIAVAGEADRGYVNQD